MLISDQRIILRTCRYPIHFRQYLRHFQYWHRYGNNSTLNTSRGRTAFQFHWGFCPPNIPRRESSQLHSPKFWLSAESCPESVLFSFRACLGKAINVTSKAHWWSLMLVFTCATRRQHDRTVPHYLTASDSHGWLMVLSVSFTIQPYPHHTRTHARTYTRRHAHTRIFGAHARTQRAGIQYIHII